MTGSPFGLCKMLLCLAVPRKGWGVPHSCQASWDHSWDTGCSHQVASVPSHVSGSQRHQEVLATESPALPKALAAQCEGVLRQPHTPGLGWEPAELSQLETRIFPSQAGSHRMLGARTWLLKHSHTGSSSPREATAYCCKRGALSQILWKTWIISML